MTMLRGTIKGGRLELDVPLDWPDGTEVEIHPVLRGAMKGTPVISKEEIARTLAAMDLIEPFEMTDDERASWETERQAGKERDKAQFAEHAEKLRRQWE
jgi:hypothetical protein